MKIIIKLKAAYAAFKNPLLMIDDKSLYGIIGYDGVAILKTQHIGKHLTYVIHALTSEQQSQIKHYLTT